jgi:hypothetical protein
MIPAHSSSSLLSPVLSAGRRLLRALGLLTPDTAGLFLGLADDLFAAWPLEEDEVRLRALGAVGDARVALPLAA